MNLEHLNDHLPAAPSVVQRRDTQRMRVALRHRLPVENHQLVAGALQASDRADRYCERDIVDTQRQFTYDKV